MRKIILGKTGIEVTELCFGALPLGPLQKDISIEEATDVISYALEKGINYVDTAQMYGTYPHIRSAIEKCGITPIISTKSAASDYDTMEAAINEALTQMDIKAIDIFFLHAARAPESVFEDRSGAIKAIMDYREKGIIKSMGISTHDVKVVRKACENKEMDIIFPIANKIGMGVLNGTKEEMEAEIKNLYEAGKGVVIMKALAGGNLISDYQSAFDYVFNITKQRSPIAVGIVSKDEIDMNIKLFNGEDISYELANIKDSRKRFYVVPTLCKRCGKCINVCHSNALSMKEKNAEIDEAMCLKCGYCVKSCPEFAIRMI